MRSAAGSRRRGARGRARSSCIARAARGRRRAVRQKTQGRCVCRAADAERVAALALALATGGKRGNKGGKGGKAGGPAAAGVAAAFIGGNKPSAPTSKQQQSVNPASTDDPFLYALHR